MKINLKEALQEDFKEIDIEKGMLAKDLANEYKDQVPYMVLACKINNQVFDLNTPINNTCTIEFLDMRTQAANLIYQYSLTLLFLRCLHEVAGTNVKCEIQNSLNKGLFITVKIASISEELIKKIEDLMKKKVNDDLPITCQKLSREQAIIKLANTSLTEKLRLLKGNDEIETVNIYTLDGESDFFYDLMVPSTGYLTLFELRKYKNGLLLRFPHPSNPSVIPPYEDEKNLYAAFGEATRWDKLTHVNYVADLNEKIDKGDYKELIQLSEALHEKKISDIADQIKQLKKRIILITGPSSSGKTTFARRLSIQLKVNGLDPLYIGTDDYFVDRGLTPIDENGEKDYESLKAVDVKLFNENLNDLLKGKKVDLPRFDFFYGNKVFGERICSIDNNQPIIVEGIHALNQALTTDIDDEQKFKIYISPLTQLNIDENNRIPTTDERMLRRLVRDSQFRGRSAKTTLSDWHKVRKGEDINIFPYNGQADVFFNSYHIYEVCVLKKYAKPLLEQITQDEPEYAEAIRMLHFLEFFKTIDNDSMIVNNSIIREFIGGSIFVQ